MWALWSKFLKPLWREVWKGWFQLMQILDLLGMYFDAVVVFVTKFSLLFKFALIILWQNSSSMATAGLCYSSMLYILQIHTKGKSFASVSLDPFLECRTNFWAFGSGQQQTLGRFFLWVWLTHLLTWLRLSDKLTQKSLLCLRLARQLLETFSLCTIVLY